MSITAFVIGLVVFFIWSRNEIKNKEKKRREEKEEREIQEFNDAANKVVSLILFHKRTLAVKRIQLIRKDDYGNELLEDWNKEVSYFVENVLRKESVTSHFLFNCPMSLDDGPVSVESKLYYLQREVDRIAEWESSKITIEATHEGLDVDKLSGEDFEIYCANILGQHGWDARLTKASGDQGIDIFAEINGVTAIFQCKRYSQPIGNSAVQEAIAAKSFARSDVAAVVTNSVFTKSAKELAQATNVYLLHYAELGGFSKIFIS